MWITGISSFDVAKVAINKVLSFYGKAEFEYGCLLCGSCLSIELEKGFTIVDCKYCEDFTVKVEGIDTVWENTSEV